MEFHEILIQMTRVYQILFVLLTSALANIAFAGIEVGQPAPNIEGTLIDGKPFSLQANKGKVVLVNFWASWCEPCREEMPAIEAFLKKNKSKGLEVLAITVDKPADMQQVKLPLSICREETNGLLRLRAHLAYPKHLHHRQTRHPQKEWHDW